MLHAHEPCALRCRRRHGRPPHVCGDRGRDEGCPGLQRPAVAAVPQVAAEPRDRQLGLLHHDEGRRGRPARGAHPQHDHARVAGVPVRLRARHRARPCGRRASRQPPGPLHRRHRVCRHRRAVVLVRDAAHLRLRLPAQMAPHSGHADHRRRVRARHRAALHHAVRDAHGGVPARQPALCPQLHHHAVHAGLRHGAACLWRLRRRGHVQAHLPQRAHPGHHAPGHGNAPACDGCHHHRDHLLLAGCWPLLHHGDQGDGLSRRHVDPGAFLHARHPGQPAR